MRDRFFRSDHLLRRAIPELGVAKQTIYALKRNICHFVWWGMLHFGSREGNFATVASVNVETG